MSARTHRCIRCGIDVYVRGSFCRDCYDVERSLIASWRKSA